MYCGNCLRDNSLVSAYRSRGHAVTMVPLYLPLTLDETDHTAGTPIFFGGVNVYLDHKAAAFRSAPEWLRRWLAHPALLAWTSRFAARTRPEDVADLTLSMLRGEEGNQARDLSEFIDWLRTQPRPEVVCLSNALLLGMARRLKTDLGVRVVCQLSGEDAFLDAMSEPLRSDIWSTLTDRARDVDAFVAPSAYFASRMGARMNIPASRLHVVPLGLNLAGYPKPEIESPVPPATPTIGYLARMCRDKGLDTLVEAFIEVRRRDRVKGVRLKIGGSCGPSDEPLVAELRARLHGVGLLGEVEFHPNLDRAAKIEFLRSLSVFSVPALYGEAFGLYLLEAMAAGVPLVQPRHAGFPEVIAQTGGGLLCKPDSPLALAETLEDLLSDPIQRGALARAGHRAVHERHGVDAVAERMIEVLKASPAAAEPADRT